MRVKRLVCVSTFNKYTNAVVVRAFLFFSRLPFGLFSLLFFFFLHITRTIEKHSRIIHYYYVLFIFPLSVLSVRKQQETKWDETFSFFAFFFSFRLSGEKQLKPVLPLGRCEHGLRTPTSTKLMKVAILQPLLTYLKNNSWRQETGMDEFITSSRICRSSSTCILIVSAHPDEHICSTIQSHLPYVLFVHENDICERRSSPIYRIHAQAFAIFACVDTHSFNSFPLFLFVAFIQSFPMIPQRQLR